MSITTRKQERFLEQIGVEPITRRMYDVERANEFFNGILRKDPDYLDRAVQFSSKKKKKE